MPTNRMLFIAQITEGTAAFCGLLSLGYRVTLEHWTVTLMCFHMVIFLGKRLHSAGKILVSIG